MDAKEIERRLGIAPGTTLTALVALAERIAPKAPADAFGELWLHLPWLDPKVSLEDLRYGTPKNVHPFAETGGDLNHFGFLMDGALPTDERSIVYVVPKDDDEATHIVAPNLRAFLGLVATAFGEVVSRDATDADWARFRQDWYGEDPECLKEMARLSELLCTIPGVERPASPSKVANACPDKAFRLVFDDEDDGDDAPRPAPPKDFKSNSFDAQQASRLAQEALAQGRFDEAIAQAQNGVQSPAYQARCLFTLAYAYQRAGQPVAAKRTAEQLLAAWLNPSPVALPGVHARLVIERDSLSALLEELFGAQAQTMVAQVRTAPDLEDTGGDFL